MPETLISAPSAAALLSAAMTRWRRRAEWAWRPFCHRFGPRARRPWLGGPWLGAGHAQGLLVGEGGAARTAGRPGLTPRCLRVKWAPRALRPTCGRAARAGGSVAPRTRR